MVEIPATLTETEQKVLDIINADPDAWFQCFHPDIMAACGGSFDLAEITCRSLRRNKLVDAEGRGKFGQYGKKR